MRRIASHRTAPHRIASHRIVSRRVASHRTTSHRTETHRSIFRGTGTNHDGIANLIVASIKAYGRAAEAPLAFAVIGIGRGSTDPSTDSR